MDDVPIAVDGARWVFPHSIGAAQAGDEVTVFARRAVQQKLTVSIAGARTPLSPVAVTPALVGRAVAGAEIVELDGKLATLKGDEATKLRKDIVERSVASRIVSSQTSMLVLETDGDYARYGIDRKSLADILEVGPTGIEMHHRIAPPAQIAQKDPPKKPQAQIATEKYKEDKKAERHRDDSPTMDQNEMPDPSMPMVGHDNDEGRAVATGSTDVRSSRRVQRPGANAGSQYAGRPMMPARSPRCLPAPGLRRRVIRMRRRRDRDSAVAEPRPSPRVARRSARRRASDDAGRAAQVRSTAPPTASRSKRTASSIAPPRPR